MTNTKHTPGPWVCKSNGYYFDVGVDSGCDGIVHPTVCMGVEFEQEANARLIAAAPDLLEALKGMVDCFDDMPGLDEYQAALYAIAKAEGGE